MVFNRYLNFSLFLLWLVLAESCKTPSHIEKELNIEENTVIDELDDTTTVIKKTTVISMPTDSGGTKTITNEETKTIKHKKKRGKNNHKVSKDATEIDGLTPVLEKEKTKREASRNKASIRIAKESRKNNYITYLKSLPKRLLLYFIFALLLYLWIKRKTI